MGRTTQFSEFKRDVEGGNLYLKIVERYGCTGDGIPLRLRGYRRVDRVTSSSVVLINCDGVESALSYTSTKLIRYDGEYLYVYDPGKRGITDEEAKVLDDAKYINPWLKASYFANSKCPWMYGNSIVKGKIYTYDGKVQDNNILGRLILKYEVVRR